MAKRDYIHCSVHESLANEIRRVHMECQKIGIFVNKKWASAIVAEKSKNHKMNQKEITEFIKKMKGVLGDEQSIKKL